MSRTSRRLIPTSTGHSEPGRTGQSRKFVDIYLARKTMGGMLTLSDSQLRTVWAAADRVPFEKRGVFVERVVARLQLQRGFTDADLDDVVRAALTGLIQSAA